MKLRNRPVTKPRTAGWLLAGRLLAGAIALLAVLAAGCSDTEQQDSQVAVPQETTTVVPATSVAPATTAAPEAPVATTTTAAPATTEPPATTAATTTTALPATTAPTTTTTAPATAPTPADRTPTAPTGQAPATPTPQTSQTQNPSWLSDKTLQNVPANLPLNPAVSQGTLSNGLSYFIAENARPQTQVELRLVVAAGSVNETADQSGIAHFLEHMLFNGTEDYPKNELVAFLESLGIAFGPDLNAFTSYDETVYTLSLSSNDTELISTALDVLVQWAGHATLLPADTIAERGVIDAEWLESTSGASGLFQQNFDQIVLGGTTYAGKHPLGEQDAIQSVTDQDLWRFYEDWYQPQNMAVIAVGDFETDEMSALIRDKFAGLTAPSRPESDATAPDQAATPPPRLGAGDFSYQPPPPIQPQVAVSLSPDVSRSTAYIFMPRPHVADQNTAAAALDRLAAELVFEMLASRLSDDILLGTNPARQVSYLDYFATNFIATPLLIVSANAADMSRALDQTIAELERARRFGFDPEEFQRIKDATQSNLDAQLDESASTQHNQLARDLTYHFAAGYSAMDGTQAHRIHSEILSQITLEDVSDWIAAQLDFADPIVILVGPQSSESDLPTEADIRSQLLSTRQMELSPRADPTGDQAGQLMVPPEPAAIIAQRELPADITEFTLANGARVLHKFTDIQANSVSFAATSPGGQSLQEPDELIGWDIPESVIEASGVGDWSALELSRLLSGKTLSLRPYIEATREGFRGTASAEDLEHLMAYVHLLMTQPRVDPIALESELSGWRELLDNPSPSIYFVAVREVIGARYGDSAHFSFAPPRQLLDEITADDIIGLFEDRFGDAADFDFIVVGDISLEAAQELAQRYLGTLPSSASASATPSRETWRNLEPPPTTGAIQRKFTAGGDGQGIQYLLFTLASEPSLARIQEQAVLSEIVDVRLRERIREELSASYDPDVLLDHDIEPTPVSEAVINVATEQSRIDATAKVVLDELVGLGDTLSQAEFDTAKEKLEQNYNFVSNAYWIGAITLALNNPDLDMSEVLDRRGYLERVSYSDIVRLANDLFDPDNYIEVIVQSN